MKIEEKMEIKNKIRWLLDNFTEYFAVQVSVDTFRPWQMMVGQTGMTDIEYIKTVSNRHKMFAEIYENTGVFIYGDDIRTSINTPKIVKNVLPKLYEKHGMRTVLEELAKQIKQKDLLIKDEKERWERYERLKA